MFVPSRKKQQRDSPPPSATSGGQKVPWKPSREVSPEVIEQLNKKWQDTEQTSALWTLISENRVRELMEVIGITPELGHLRSGDGRGPMFW